MATRFYFPASQDAPVGPSVNSGWDHVNGTYRMMITASDASALATTSYAPDSSDCINDYDSHHRTYVSPPLQAQTIGAQTVKAQFQCLESHASNNVKLTIRIFRTNRTGTEQDELVSLTRASGAELATSLTNRTWTATSTSRTFSAGDRICVEIGVGGLPTSGGGTNCHNASIRWGCDASAGDLSEDETDTLLTKRGWLEFATTTILFENVTPSVSDSLSATDGNNVTVPIGVLVSDSASSADSATSKYTPILASTSSSVSATDFSGFEFPAAAEIPKEAQDSASITDSVQGKTTPINISTSSSVSVSDSVQGKPTPVNVSVSSSVAVSDDILTWSEWVDDEFTTLNLYGAAAVSDAIIAKQTPLNVALSDSLSVTDYSEGFRSGEDQVPVAAEDSVSITDAVTTQLDLLNVSVQESASVQDDVQKVVSPLSASVSSSVSAVDSVVVSWTPLNVSVSSSASVTDVPVAARTVTAIVSDSVSVTDADLAGIHPLSVAVPDSLSVTDYSEQNTFSTQDVQKTIQEYPSVTDQIAINLHPIVASVSEAASVQDSVSYKATPLNIPLSDSVSISDLPVAARTITAIVQDSISATDSSSLVATPLNAAIYDTAVVSDGTSQVVTPVFTSVSDSLSITDKAEQAASGLADINIPLSDNLSVTDELQAMEDILNVQVYEDFSLYDAIMWKKRAAGALDRGTHQVHIHGWGIG